MAKITVLEQKTFQGKPSGFKVTLDDGTTGNLSEKVSDKGLRVGDNVIVTLIPYTSKAGVTSNLIGLKLNQQNFTPSPTQTAPVQQSAVQPNANPVPRPTIHVGSGKSAQELKAEASTQILLKILGVFYEGKLESAQLSVNLMEFSRLIWSEIDEIYGSK
jgi:hypothetical protein